MTIVEPDVGWDWGWDHLVESLVAARPDGLDALLEELLLQFELAFPKKTHAATVEKMHTLIAESPACAFSGCSGELARQNPGPETGGAFKRCQRA